MEPRQPNERQKKPVMIVLTQELDERLDAIAKRNGESRSQVIRFALREFVKKEAA